MVTLEGLGKTFQSGKSPTRVLDAIDLTVQTGEFFVLVGQSGSGKSTLLRCVAGLEQPDAGVIRVDDDIIYSANDRVNRPPETRGIGMVFQSYAIWPHLSVEANITLPLTRGARRLTKAQARTEAQGILGRMGLSELSHVHATLLSGGQQQRVALARALVSGSKLILMDEPLSNLDAALREQLRVDLKRILTDFGATVLYVTHDRQEAFTLADRLGILEKGRLLAVGTPTDLYYRPPSKAVAEVLGPVNWLPGQWRNGRVTCALGSWQRSNPVEDSQSVLVGIRPERIRYPADRDPDCVQFEGTVEAVQFMGEQQRIRIAIGDSAIVVHRSPPHPFQPGERCRFDFDPRDGFLLPKPPLSVSTPASDVVGHV